MYIFLLPPAGAEEAPEEPRLLDEERRAVHRGARLDHPRARPANSCSIHILGTLWRIYSRRWFDLQALRVRCMQIYRADHSSVGIVLSGELSMIANIIKMFGSVMKYFCDCQCILLKWAEQQECHCQCLTSWSWRAARSAPAPPPPRPPPGPRAGARPGRRCSRRWWPGCRPAPCSPATRGTWSCWTPWPYHIISATLCNFKDHKLFYRTSKSAHLFTIQDRTLSTSPVGAAARLVDCWEHPNEGLSWWIILDGLWMF